ncbi:MULTISPECIES: NAD(P)/FAD-dependent oxidoreductase [unclassified Halorubrum]|uniref:NAD(P)/FAD-dependent oxidoreductase n=1 Tax=unclassified Halorubrum TaxID=2642239 RepID=UPI000B98D9E9|nr:MULTISPECIES: FAD/NAD(P)-binding oxidoreductase [unclassified Halorubrum]OYR44337.1 pyridine nucleotide-disulfide oxidoreductase [Halorubrum sp. Hd13]OYR44473.1 pyridine nucleotide-disulfide oxidoreductase [Halorubrum sp. Eb13]OYR52575.1 pyridine nucleotide-disulfide oxidoreductase [Halorubrum sp. Ea8]
MTERIVIVGGGTGGSVLANDLADRLEPELDAGDVEVTLVNDGPEQVYKPVWLYVPFGQREPADGRRRLDELVDDAVDLRIDRVSDVDTDAKRLRFDDGPSMEYDYLVLATGSTLEPERIPGLAEGGHDYYSESGATELRDELLSFTEGEIVLSVVGTPHMCPAAPLEFVFMIDDWFRKRGLREDVEVTYTYPIQRVHGNPHIAEWARPIMDERGIDVETFFNAESVDPDAGTITSMEGTELGYDLLVSIPPHAGVDLIEEAGLGDDGWVDVNKHTLEAEAADDVYALGDTAATGVPNAGSVAHYQAGVVGERLASDVRGRPATATYDGKTLCFIETGMDAASFVEFDYENPPSPAPPSQKLHWSKLAYNESYWLTARGLL